MRVRKVFGMMFCLSLGLTILSGRNAEEAIHPEEQHGDTEGHLPASRADVSLVGKIRLTDVPHGIADVSAFGHYAYLAAFNRECGAQPGVQRTGVHVVDISDPSNPVKVNFLQAEANSYVGEGVHVIEFAGRHVLVHNNETCDHDAPVVSGVALWDVTTPQAAVKLGQFGDTSPAVPRQTYHTTHSVQAFVWQNRAFVVAQDNDELQDIDIFDVTDLILGSGPAVLVWEGGLENWPQARGTSARGDHMVHHDMQQKVIKGVNFLLVSYWDAGQVLLNISDPANPVFVNASDFPAPDTLTGSEQAEGNSHQSYWSSDGSFILTADEDFAPFRTRCAIETGSHAGVFSCGEFSWTVPVTTNFPDGFEGTAVWGGTGCRSDVNSNGVPDRSEIPPATASDQILIVDRFGCMFDEKVESGELAGYAAVAMGNSHEGARHGVAPDKYVCGAGRNTGEKISVLCIGHRAMHLLFNTAPDYTSDDMDDMPPIGTVGERLSANGGVFDAWGYVRLLDASTLGQVGAYAVKESLNPAYASGFGNLTVHEVKTDPRPNVNLAYLSYYDAGLRVVKFGKQGIREVGHFIAEGGNDFWGVFPIQLPAYTPASVKANRGNPYILVSDRDYGLWILRYTGE